MLVQAGYAGFIRRAKGALRVGGSAGPGMSFPDIRPGDAAAINGLIDMFFAADTVAATEGPVRALVDITGSCAYEDDRTTWIWFVAWVAVARANGTQLTAAKIGWFCFEWHESFVPRSGQAWISLWKAEPALLSTIIAGAVDAAADLEPGTVLVPAAGMTVDAMRRLLAHEESRPAVRPRVCGAARATVPAGWPVGGTVGGVGATHGTPPVDVPRHGRGASGRGGQRPVRGRPSSWRAVPVACRSQA